jgi:murein DD-endopeptidase MepM/ murein hydrolase activator NlpD
MWADGVHKGVDLLTPTGTDVVAPWSGTVVEVGRTSWGSAFGTAVIIDFDRLPNGDPGLWGILAHLSSVTVKPGARVAVGARVGRSGATGNVSGPHLHF